MLRLIMLGGLRLERDGVPSDTAPPRRRLLALLALVAGHGALGLSRDKLLGYLWPESDASHARNSLKQALFSLRRSLGSELFPSSGDVIRCDPAAIRVDLWEFESALSNRQAAQAVAVYGGPFMDGFFVEGLGAFEQWVDGERHRLARQRIEALEQLATRSAHAGDAAQAVHWWRLIAEADPMSATGALGLMRALERAGDRAAALEHARSYAARLEAELGVGVDQEIGEFVERLSRPVAPLLQRPRLPERARPSPVPSRRSAPALTAVAASSRARAGSAPRPRSVVSIVLPVVLTVLVASVVNLARSDRVAPAISDAPPRLTVLPFETLGDAADNDAARGFDALLSSAMGGLEGYRMVPPPASAVASPSHASADAKRVGARFYVTGRLIVTPRALRAVAAVHDRANADQEVGHSEAEVERGELFALADQIVRGLVTDLYRSPGQEMSRAAATATRSLPALKAYLEGERALRDEDYVPARDAFSRAVRADTGFALAYYRWSIAADAAGEDETAGRAAALAARFSERLSEHDRRLVTAYLVGRRGTLDEAERLYRGILADYPQDTEAWLQLGELLLHGNPLRGRSAREARLAFEKVLASNPDQGDALVHLARIAALDGDSLEADSLLRRAATTAPRAGVLDLRAIRAFALNDRPGQERANRELLTQPRVVPSQMALEVATKLDDLAAAERFAAILIRAPGTCDVRALGHRMMAQIALARGTVRRFERELAEAEPCDRGAVLELRSLMAVQPFTRPTEATLAQLTVSLSSVSDTVLARPARAYYWGLVALRRGDTLTTARASRALLRTTDTTSKGELARTLGRSLRAHLRFAGGQPAAALEQLERAGWERVARLSIAEASDRFFRAELLHRLRRDDEAIGWYRSIAERASYELVYLAPAAYKLGKIFEARGDSGAAKANYRRLISLWREADPELRAPVAEAERWISTR